MALSEPVKLEDLAPRGERLHAPPPASLESPAQIRRSSFAGDVLKLVSGSTSAQLLTILAAPFVTRLFAPEAFGIAAIFASITGVISAVVGMRYELSIVLPKEDEEAANTAAVSLCFVLLTTVLTAVLVGFTGEWLLRLLRAPELRGYFWLAPVTVLLNGIYAALSYWNTRKKNFGRLTIAQLMSVVLFVALQLLAGLAGHASGGMIILATVFSALISTLFLAATTFRENATMFLHEIKPGRMTAALKRYSSFPKYSSGSAVLNNLGWQMPTFVLSAFFSAGVVGHYALGNRVLRIPVSLVGANIATVFFQHASEAKHRGTLRESVEKLFQYLADIFVFPSLLLCFIGKDLFIVVFGNPWAEAGVFTQILSVYVLFWFMAVPLGIVLNVLEKQALELRLIVAVLISRVLGLLIGGYFGNARIALALFSLAGASVYAYYCFVVLRDCSVPLSSIGRALGKQIAIFAPAGLVITVMRGADFSATAVLAVAFAWLVLYYLNLIRTNPSAREMVTGMFPKFSGDMRACGSTGTSVPVPGTGNSRVS